MTTYLVQNIETFATITTFQSTEMFDIWMDTNNEYGIVSLDADADGEYDFVALVAPVDGPDFIMDDTTGEMEPVESVDPAAELAAKMDIALEMDMNDVPQEQIVAMLNNETPMSTSTSGGEAIPLLTIGGQTHDEFEAGRAITPKKPRKTRKTKSRTKAKGAKMSQPKKIRNFEILAAFIDANPGVSRTDVFADAGLQSSLRTPAQIKSIASGDKLETKRWNRRLNFLIREMRRQNVDIQIERKGRIAHYTIGKPSGQLELPFDEAAEARNSAIIGDDVTDVVIDKPAVDPKRATEEANQSLDFEALLATLDDEAVADVDLK